MIEFEVEHEGKTHLVQFEHSLSSLSKWESIHKKPFFKRPTDPDRTREEDFDYLVCMVVSGRSHEKLVKKLDIEQKLALSLYVEMDQTATTIQEPEKPPKSTPTTSEEIYSWMIATKVPFECDKWHFSRLMTLIRLRMIQLDQENNPKGKRMTAQERQARIQSYRELNERRRKEMGTNG